MELACCSDPRSHGLAVHGCSITRCCTGMWLMAGCNRCMQGGAGHRLRCLLVSRMCARCQHRPVKAAAAVSSPRQARYQGLRGLMTPARTRHSCEGSKMMGASCSCCCCCCLEE